MRHERVIHLSRAFKDDENVVALCQEVQEKTARSMKLSADKYFLYHYLSNLDLNHKKREQLRYSIDMCYECKGVSDCEQCSEAQKEYVRLGEENERMMNICNDIMSVKCK